MDSLVDASLLGLVCWNLPWLTVLGAEHNEKLVDYEALAFEHRVHKPQTKVLKYELEKITDQASVLETSLINKLGTITGKKLKKQGV
jgi:hypothetical protein